MRPHTFFLLVLAWVGFDWAPSTLAMQAVPPQSRGGVAVIRPKSFAPSLQRWEVERIREGYHFHEIDSDTDPYELRAKLQQLASADRDLRYVVLAADAPAIQLPVVHSMKDHTVPTFYQDAQVIQKFGPEKSLATDLPYADLDGDSIPELAIGRIPVDNPTQLLHFLNRVLELEKTQDFGIWRRDIQLVAGVGGFGTVIDTTIEMVTRRFLTDGIPDEYALKLLYASPTSVYCPSPERFSETFLSDLNRGNAFWIYVGHGHIETLDQFRAGSKNYRILDNGMLDRIAIQSGSPVAVFLACYTGAFDAPNDSLAERLIGLPNGPIAAIAGSRVTMPYGMSCIGWELMRGCFQKRTRTIGELMLEAKQHALLDEPIDEATRANRKLLDQLAVLLNPQNEDLRQERLEHVALLHLLGDPTMQLQYPIPIELEAPGTADPESTCAIQGLCPIDVDEVLVQLAYRRDQTPPQVRGRSAFRDTIEVRKEMDATYDLATKPILQELRLPVQNGAFRGELQLPDQPRAKLVILCYANNKKSWAAGSKQLTIRKPVAPKS